MTIEIALVILIIIMVVTELMKSISQNYTIGQKHNLCKCNREGFAEQQLFERNMCDKVTLRYW